MTLPAPTAFGPEITPEAAAASNESSQPMKCVDSTNVLLVPPEDYAEGVLGNVVPLSVFRALLGPLGDNFRLDGVQAYRKKLRAEFARPGNQLDAMLVDQLAWCHIESGHLLANSSTASDPKEKEVLCGSAIKLMAEVRKTALTLRDLQTPPAVKQVTVVKQQNVAAGDQQVALIEAGAAESALGKQNSNTELVSNGGREDHERLIAADPATDRWSVEPAEAQAPVLCRP